METFLEFYGKNISKAYIKKYKTVGDFDVWIVDGNYIRTNIDEEFTNTGQHYRFSFIPEKELWIDKEAHKDETEVFIYELKKEFDMMKNKKDFSGARSKLEKIFKAKEKLGLQIPETKEEKQKYVHKQLWKEINGIKVWIVDGRRVRALFYSSFTEGGHGYVYDFIPKDEIWIDDDIFEKERPFILLHEIHERNLMKNKKFGYNHAHKLSSKLEHKFRKEEKGIWEEINKNAK